MGWTPLWLNWGQARNDGLVTSFPGRAAHHGTEEQRETPQARVRQGVGGMRGVAHIGASEAQQAARAMSALAVCGLLQAQRGQKTAIAPGQTELEIGARLGRQRFDIGWLDGRTPHVKVDPPVFLHLKPKRP